jgi:hypothetical protein
MTHLHSCANFILFWQAAVSALQNQPIVNAVIDGDDIIYRDYVDVSVAVGTSKVPPLSDDRRSFSGTCACFLSVYDVSHCDLNFFRALCLFPSYF